MTRRSDGRLLAGRNEINRKKELVKETVRTLRGLIQTNVFRLEKGWRVEVSIGGEDASMAFFVEARIIEMKGQVLFELRERQTWFVQTLSDKDDPPSRLIPSMYDALGDLEDAVAALDPRLKAAIDFIRGQAPEDPPDDAE